MPQAAARRGHLMRDLGALPLFRPHLSESDLTLDGAGDRDYLDQLSYGWTGTEKTLVAQLVSAPPATSVRLWMYSTPMKMRPLKNWLAE